MTRNQAIARARVVANRRGVEMLVVWSIEDSDASGANYHVAREEDMEGFYQGCDVIACVDPDGDEQCSEVSR